jgi:hypothetical protein
MVGNWLRHKCIVICFEYIQDMIDVVSYVAEKRGKAVKPKAFWTWTATCTSPEKGKIEGVASNWRAGALKSSRACTA